MQRHWQWLLALGLLVISSACSETSESPVPDAVETAPLPTASTQSLDLDDRGSDSHSEASSESDSNSESETFFHASHPYTAFHGAATASLEERIHFSDVIVRATLLSASNGELRFRAIEYLMGSGPAEFSLTADAENQQNNQESILLLSHSQTASDGVTGVSGSALSFTDTTTTVSYGYYSAYDATYAGELPAGNTPGSSNPVWLPRTAPSGGVTGASEDFIEYFIDTDSEAITLTDLRDKIAWVQGDGTAPYRGCVAGTLLHRRYIRDWVEHHQEPWKIAQLQARISAGQPKGTVIYVYDDAYENPEDYDDWLSGHDADLFKAEITDFDNDPLTRNDVVISTVRPLPAGAYTIINHMQRVGYREICNGILLRNRLQWNIDVSPSPDTLHEALFDPATSTAGTVGFSADPAAGVLEPTLLVATTSREIEGLEWADGEVRLTLSPFGALPGWQFEFLNLDADVILTLPTHIAVKDRAARTLTWDVPSQPWTSGDQLMLRVVPIPLPEPHPSLELRITFAFGNAGLELAWEAIDEVNFEPTTAYSIEWASTRFGPWAVVDSAGDTGRCVPRMSFETGEETDCYLKYAAAGIQAGPKYYFRLVAYNDDGDTALSPYIQLR